MQLRRTILTSLVLMLVGLICAPSLAHEPAYRAPIRQAEVKKKPPYKYHKIIKRMAKKYDVSPDLIAAMIKLESNFDPKATSHVGARGLMQVMPATAKPLAKKLGWEDYDLYDPEQNIELGTYFFSWLLKKYNGDIRMALSYYNGGSWAIVSRGVYRNPSYSRVILDHYRTYKTYAL